MHLLMFFLYFVEAGESIPFTICWCEDRFIRKWTSTAASEGSKCLIKSVILKKAEKEQWGRKFFSVINLSGGGKIFHSGEKSDRLQIVFLLDATQPDMQRKQGTLDLQKLGPGRCMEQQ